MADVHEARFREHLSMLRQAAKGLGLDLESEFRSVEKDIAELPKAVGKEADHLLREIDYDLFSLSVKIHRVHQEFKKLPRKVSDDAQSMGRKAVWFGKKGVAATAAAGKAVKKDVKKELAKAAGIHTDPIQEWHYEQDKERER